jgi:Bacterial Ig domain/Chitobiase/beta-hexosaminidase C-terminal domain/PASTA domain
MQPTETGPTAVGPAAVLREGLPVRTAAAIVGAAAVFLAIVFLAGVGRPDTSTPGFLEQALGPENSEAPLERTPATGVGVRIDDKGYTVTHSSASLAVTSEDVDGADWRRHVDGVTRETDFGAETIVVDGTEAEEFLTVAERQGTKTWRWQLASRLQPRPGRDGSVTFLDPTSGRVSSIVIDPVRILDADGQDVTPDGLRWGLQEGDSGWILTLKLDDADLPLPYVIDPAVTHRAPTTATTTGATSITVDVPAGVQPNDLLVAHIARVGNAAITTPSGWTAAGGANGGNLVRQATYYRVAGAAEPASYTWTWTATQAAAGGMSAYYGVKASAPLGLVGTAASANNATTVTAPSLTTTANDALVLAFFASNTNSTFSTASGMSERYEIGTTGAVSLASDDMAQAVAGPTGAMTSTATTSGRVVGHQVSFNVDDVAPTGSFTDPGSALAGTVPLTADADDLDSAVAGVLFQRSPADADTWTTIGAADTASPYSASFDTIGVADGLYDLRVVITDVAGNMTSSTIEDRLVDNTAPAAPALTLAESSPYAHAFGTEIFVNTAESGSYDVEAATSDALAGIDKVFFPGGVEDADAPYAASYDFDDLSGAQTVTAHDGAGNAASAGFEVTEDVSAPSTTDDTTSIGSAWQTAPVSVTLTPTDAGAGVAATYYTTDGSVPTTSSDQGASVDLAVDGAYVVRYFSVDNVGNAEPVQTASATIRIDQTAPDAPSISLSESSPYADTSGDQIFVNPNQTGTYDVTATSSDTGSGIDRIVFPGNAEDSTSPYATTYDLDDLTGPQTVTVHDAAGLTADDTFSVTPDGAGPTGGSVDYPDGYDADGTVTVTVDAGTDALAGVDAASGVVERQTSALVDGVCDPFVGGWDAVSSPDTVAEDTCARYRYRVSDRVGNEAVFTLPTSTVKVDLTSPQTTIDAAPGDPTADSSASFAFSSNEGGASFECRLDDGDWDACSSPQDYTGLADGVHTFEVRAADAARNADGTPASHGWTIDTEAPSTSLGIGPADPSNDAGASFEFSASEDGAGFECRLDGGAWAPCTSPQGYTGLGDGGHAFEVRATDTVGNIDGSPASQTWTVDTIAPDSSFTVVPANLSGNSTPTFEFTASEDGSSFECRLDGGDWDACSSPETTAPLFDGSHTLDVRATDTAGNVDGSPAAYTWTIDATAPGGGLIDPGTFVRRTVPLTASPSDTGGVQSVEFQVSSANADSWTSIGVDPSDPYSVDWNTTALADGAYDLRIVVTDNAGNSGPSSLVEDRVVDNTAPTKPLAFTGTVSGRTFSLSWRAASDNSGTISVYRIYANGVPVKTVSGSSRSAPMGIFRLTDTRAFQVAAVDGAGNVGPLSPKLKVVPKLTKLTVAAAKKALRKRGFKLGKVTYRASASVPKGRVVAGTAKGLRPAGFRIGLIVSKGRTGR